MTAPNIVNVASIIGTTVVADLGTTLTTTLVTAATDTVCKINLIRISNITDSDATTTIDSEVGGVFKTLANEITVPANSAVDIIDKNSSFYLQETDLIRGGASAASTLQATISFEVINDA
tara:strand:+ start:254 stop:613 length:360 start_codon:yes stop_codon:yes gene_type:complete